MISKQYTTVATQVTALIDKGFIVDDSARVTRFIKQVGYYRLRGYILLFRNRDGSYQRGVDFERVIRLYEFDTELHAWLWPLVRRIECYLRAGISEYIADKYGPYGYLEDSIFDLDGGLIGEVFRA